MIVPMSRVRIMGPRDKLDTVVLTLQDLAVLHLSAPTTSLPPVALSPAQERHRTQFRAALIDVEQVLSELGLATEPAPRSVPRPTASDLAAWIHAAARLRRELAKLAAHDTALDEERALILKYQHFFSAFRSLLESETRWPRAKAYHVLVRRGDATVIPALQASLARVIGDEFQLYREPLASGETAVLVVVSGDAAAKVERLLADARVQELAVPEAYGGGTLTSAVPRMLQRLGEIPGERASSDLTRADLRVKHREMLLRARAALHDELQAIEAVPLSAETSRAFVIEGWLPRRARGDLDRALAKCCGGDVVTTEVAAEEWHADEAPVVLTNPRLFRPFETLIRPLPLPRYGTIDPTPFVAVFFPAFFGLMVGDIGYGAALGLLALLIHARSKPASTLRNIAEIAGPCALFSIIAGALYGEFFGNLGTTWFHLRPLLFDRREAIVPFLLLSVAIGVVHVVLGLVLAAVSARATPRAAIGRGVSALMVLLLVLAVLAAVKVLPHQLLTPAVIGLLIAFPLVVALEGVVAMVELLSTFGNILSYARIMALGTASVMLAVVANRMGGAMGSVTVGIVFALLFHIVNFALALFSPTVHALRLHYVEFFGKFYNPGGVRYEPLTRWARIPSAEPASTTPSRPPL